MTLKKAGKEVDKMKGTKSRRVYEMYEVKNFKELLKMVDGKYANNIAYK